MFPQFALDYDSGVPIYRQVCEAVRAAVVTGLLTADEQLPTIHELAQRLDINPNTVARAYRELEKDGFITGVRGRGTFPLPQKAPSRHKREAVLRQIVDRALRDAAQLGIHRSELIKSLKEAKS